MMYTIINIVNETDAYRLEALVELGRAWPQSLTAAEIARRRNVPAQFLARLLGELAREELVVTARGARGGVRLATAPGDVPLARLLRVQPQPEAGGPAVRWLSGRVAEARVRALANLSLAELLRVEDEANATADFAI
jgi:DNA-binding IscR family transcriptional regulator